MASRGGYSSAISRSNLVPSSSDQLIQVLESVGILARNVRHTRAINSKVRDALINNETYLQAFHRFTGNVLPYVGRLNSGRHDVALGLEFPSLTPPLPPLEVGGFEAGDQGMFGGNGEVAAGSGIPDVWDEASQAFATYTPALSSALEANSFTDHYVFEQGYGLTHEYEMVDNPARSATNPGILSTGVAEHGNGDAVFTSSGTQVGSSNLYTITVGIERMIPLLTSYQVSQDRWDVTQWQMNGVGGSVTPSTHGDIATIITDEVVGVYRGMRPFTGSQQVIVTAQTLATVINAGDVNGQYSGGGITRYIAPSLVSDAQISQAIRSAVEESLGQNFSRMSSQDMSYTDMQINVQIAGMNTGAGVNLRDVTTVNSFRKWFSACILNFARSYFVPTNGEGDDTCFYHALLPFLRREIVSTSGTDERESNYFFEKSRLLARLTCLISDQEITSANFEKEGVYGFRIDRLPSGRTALESVKGIVNKIFTEVIPLRPYRRGRCPNFFELVEIAWELQRDILTFDMEQLALVPQLTVTMEEIYSAVENVESTVNYAGDSQKRYLLVDLNQVAMEIVHLRGSFDTVRNGIDHGMMSWKYKQAYDYVTGNYPEEFTYTRVFDERAYNTTPITLGFLGAMNHIFSLTSSTSIAQWVVQHNLTHLNSLLLCNDMAYVTDGYIRRREAKRRASSTSDSSESSVIPRSKNLFDDVRRVASLCYNCGKFSYGKSHRCKTTFCVSCIVDHKVSKIGHHESARQHALETGNCTRCEKCNNDVPMTCMTSHRSMCSGRVVRCLRCNRQIRVKGTGSITLEDHQMSACSDIVRTRCSNCKTFHSKRTQCVIGPLDPAPATTKETVEYTWDIETYMHPVDEFPTLLHHTDESEELLEDMTSPNRSEFSQFDSADEIASDALETSASILPSSSWSRDRTQRFQHRVNAICVQRMPNVNELLVARKVKSKVGSRHAHEIHVKDRDELDESGWDEETRTALAGKGIMEVTQYLSAKYLTDSVEGETKWAFDELREFFDFFMNLDHDATFIAHNGSKYDTRFLVDYCYRTGICYPERIVGGGGTGVTILIFKFKREEEAEDGTTRVRYVRVSFKDSCKFFATSLKKLPKTVGCTMTELLGLEKDHFPHAFHNESTQYYVGPLPERKYWPVMSDDEWDELCRKHWAGRYDLRGELIRYCYQDCNVLAFALTYFKVEFISLCNINPFMSSTAASLAMRTFRTRFLNEHAMIQTIDEDFNEHARMSYKGARTEVFVNMWSARGNSNFLSGLSEMGVDDVTLDRLRRYEHSRSETRQHDVAAYFDVTSLYPYVMDQFKLIGTEAPVRYGPGELPENWLSLEGIITCVISTPEFVPIDFIPVIPTRDTFGNASTYKLRFRKMDREKVTVTMVDLRLAIDSGYVIHSVIRFDSYGEGIVGREIFGSYIATFLKIKTENGKEFDVDHPDTIAMCEEFKQRFGIELDRDEMRKPKNTGRKLVSKLTMNSLYGKTAEAPKPKKQVMRKGEFITDVVTKIISEGMTDLRMVGWQPLPNPDHCLEEDAAVLVTTFNEKDKNLMSRTHVGLGSYITALARSVLTKMALTLKELGGTIMYCDTDSLIFSMNRSQLQGDGMTRTQGLNVMLEDHFRRLGAEREPHFRFGGMLGEWEDEFGDDWNIVEYVGLLPKTYSLKVERTDENGVLLETKYLVKSKGVQVTSGSNSFVRGTYIVSKCGTLRAELRCERDWHTAYKAMAIDPSNFSLEQRYNIMFVSGKDDSTIDSVRRHRKVNMRFNEKRRLQSLHQTFDDETGKLICPESLFDSTEAVELESGVTPFKPRIPGKPLNYHGLKRLGEENTTLFKASAFIDYHFQKEDLKLRKFMTSESAAESLGSDVEAIFTEESQFSTLSEVLFE